MNQIQITATIQDLVSSQEITDSLCQYWGFKGNYKDANAKAIFLRSYLSKIALKEYQMSRNDIRLRPPPKIYTTIPSADALSNPVTIIPSDQYATGFYNSTLLGPTKEAKLNGAFVDGFNMRDAVGTPGTHIKLVNTAGTVIGTTSTTTHGIQTNNTDPDYLDIMGLDPSNPMLIRSGAAQNGIQLGSKSTGSHFKIRNTVVDSPGASGYTFNFKNSDAKFYENLDLSYMRAFNCGQEGIYIGGTDATYDHVNVLNLSHFYSYNTSREAVQIGHVNAGSVSYCTGVHPGQSGGVGQDGGFQCHDFNGNWFNNVWDGGPTGGTVFSHGVSFRNMYVRWTYLKPFFIGDATTSYFSTSPRVNGRPQIWDNCIFHCDAIGTLLKAIQVAEVGCNISITNSLFYIPGCTTIFDDIRAGSPTNSLIQNGNTIITTPLTWATYQSQIYSDYLTHGLLTSSFNYDRRQGYRNI